jgi:hypothetical protein
VVDAQPDANLDISKLENVVLQGQISEYFDILSVESGGNGMCTYDADGNVTVTGGNIAPDDEGFASNELTLEITFRAKAEFLGGNRVPVFAEGGTFSLIPDGGAGTKVLFAEDADADYCNVPLKLSVETCSYSYALSNPQSYAVTELYAENTDYTDYRIDLTAHWQSAYLASLSGYKVTCPKDGGEDEITGAVSPTETTTYTVSLFAVPRFAAAKVGPANPMAGSTFSATAVITIVTENEIPTGKETGEKILVTKGLSYDTDGYHFEVTLDGTQPIAQQSTQQEEVVLLDDKPSTESKSYEVEESGW